MTADRSAAADTLRDELIDELREAHDTIADQGREGCWFPVGKAVDGLLPVVRRYADAQVAAALAAVRALLDPDAEMATWVAGHRYFEEADIRRALDGAQP